MMSCPVVIHHEEPREPKFTAALSVIEKLGGGEFSVCGPSNCAIRSSWIDYNEEADVLRMVGDWLSFLRGKNMELTLHVKLKNQ